MAKYNYSSNEWLPIQPLLPGPVADLCFGDVGQDAMLYAVGTINFTLNQDIFLGIAGCNETGEWVDNVHGGYSSGVVYSIFFLNGNLIIFIYLFC
jgi:hypothetical protein